MADETVNPKAIQGRQRSEMHAVPIGPLFEIGAVMLGAPNNGGGALTYGFFNWRDAPIELHDYTNAVWRHFEAILRGEDIDPKSGKRHWAHIAATATIVMDAMDHGTLVDDRWKPKERPACERFCAECWTPARCLKADRCVNL